MGDEGKESGRIEQDWVLDRREDEEML